MMTILSCFNMSIMFINFLIFHALNLSWEAKNCFKSATGQGNLITVQSKKKSKILFTHALTTDKAYDKFIQNTYESRLKFVRNK